MSDWKIDKVRTLEGGKYLFVSLEDEEGVSGLSLSLSANEFRDLFLCRRVVHATDFDLGSRLENIGIRLMQIEHTLEEQDDSNKS